MASQNMEAKKIYFKNLDAIRFVAAFMVILSHGLLDSYPLLHIDGTFLLRFLTTISTGGTGVSIFFVLSGFLITYLLITEYESKGSIQLKNFYIRRILRIWPLYYAVIIFSFFIYPAIRIVTGKPPSDNLPRIFYYLTFLSNIDVKNVYMYCHNKLTGPHIGTWSVSVEEQFYLFWPLLFTFLPKKTWVYAISAVLVASVVYRVIHNDSNFAVLYYLTFSVLVDLAIGGLFAYYIKTNTAVRDFFESVSTGTHLMLFVFSFSLLLWGDLIFFFPYAKALGRVFTSFSFAMIIAAQAMTTRASPLNLSNFSFGNKWGKYTYGMYLLHPIAIILMEFVVHKITGSKEDTFLTYFFSTVFGFILTLVMSWLSYEYFESKFLALKHKFEVIKTAR